MTPRQAVAWMLLGVDRHKRERAERLSDTALAAQGSDEKIRKAMRELDA